MAPSDRAGTLAMNGHAGGPLGISISLSGVKDISILIFITYASTLTDAFQSSS